MTTLIKKPSGQRKEWPKIVTAGNVSVKVYRAVAKTNADGFSYIVAWHAADGRKTQQFANKAEALEEAGIKAKQLAAGRIEGAEMTSGDRDELQAARKIAAALKMPLLAALDSFLKAWEATGGHVMEAAQMFAQKQGTAKFKRALVPVAIKEFIAAKNSAGKQGSDTYSIKLKPVALAFPDRHLDEITAADWSTFLTQYQGATRNDRRTRITTLCAWARDVAGYLPRGAELEIGRTEIVKEAAPEVGIMTPEEFGNVLEWVRANNPHHLAAAVIAGFCGLRSDEIQGKKADGRDKRQTWEDIDTAAKHLNVSAAKTNTPAWRLVPLCDAAIAWLKLCPGERKGPICDSAAMKNLRAVLAKAGFKLPDNAFRHSFITYRIAATGDKARTAEVAGNSVQMIDKHYRRPQPEATGKAWFSVMPKAEADAPAERKAA